MRRAQKKQAEDFLQVLGQAHDEIKKSMECGDLPMALELLGQCQQGAIQLGTLIETTEGEGFVTVVILEEYCELVYQIFEQVSREQEVDILSRYQQLCQLYNRIVDSVRLDIKVRLEAVFLPYKASMWDSLESVWQAADADPDCDAYVIPIPYYDKNSDGSFGQRHYEIRQYPKYVPVVRYEDYDFEKRRPDMIFIHNPYPDESSQLLLFRSALYKGGLRISHIYGFDCRFERKGFRIQLSKQQHLVQVFPGDHIRRCIGQPFRYLFHITNILDLLFYFPCRKRKGLFLGYNAEGFQPHLCKFLHIHLINPLK